MIVDYSFIFYGSLMDEDLVNKVCQFLPTTTRMGFIKGSLFEVTDYTEPNQIFKYPLAVLDNSGEFIIAKLNIFSLNEQEFNDMKARLIDFEGYLYELTQAIFHGFSNQENDGFIFVAKTGLNLDGHERIRKLSPIAGVYLWNKECT